MSYALIDKGILLHDTRREWKKIIDNAALDDALASRVIDPDTLSIRLENIFEFAKITDYNHFHVVILGQDPYINLHEPHGLAFSSLIKIPKSLKNIYACLLKHKLIDRMPARGNLSRWAAQGVLLLNCALTTQIGVYGAHTRVWKNYTDTLIRHIAGMSSETRPIIFLLWGAFAQKKKRIINAVGNAHTYIFEYAHPSPLQRLAPFEDCPNFTEAGEILKRYKLPAINWNPDAPAEPKANTPHFSKAVVQNLQVNDKTLIAFTDGSCDSGASCARTRAGYACAFEANVNFKDVIIYGSLDISKHYATCVRAEGYAILRVLQYCISMEKYNDSWNRLVILTDCQLWKNMIMEFIPTWKVKGIPFSDRENADLTAAIDLAVDMLTYEKIKCVELIYVESAHKITKAKRGSYAQDSYEKFCIVGNDYVDKLANYARLNLLPGKSITDYVSYEDA